MSCCSGVQSIAIAGPVPVAAAAAAMRSGTLCCALLLLAAAGAGAARLVLPGSTHGAGEAVAQSPVVPAVEHSNNRPLIGILAQACHNCPGRRALLLFEDKL